jgi:hypothetical protein
MFFDDIRVGNNTATLGDMVGGTGGGIVPPVPPVTDELNLMVDNDQVLELPVNATTFVSRISGMKAGAYVVKLSATGPDGAAATDEIKIDVKPVEVIPPEPPDTSEPIKAFILVNAETEKDVVTIAEGASISLATSGNKLNVKVTTNENVNRVEFVCTGPTPKSSNDKGTPFTLQGDSLRTDGSVNYNYGNWGPPAIGAYKIVAKPFDSTGKEMTGKTINFSFKA